MNPNISSVAAAISEPSRAAMLVCLMDGSVHPASELALAAKIKPQTASFHLNKLMESNLICAEKHGRHRYYRLVNNEAAEIVEKLLQLSTPEPVKSLRQASEKKAIDYARTCYDHLAGHVGVALTTMMIDKGYLEKDDLNFILTPEGEQLFTRMEIDLEEAKKKRRAFAKCCLDWTERRYHLAGSLGHALLERMFELEWLTRIPGTRAVKVTASGKAGLKEFLSLEL
ncbi:ArsR/SmtB family transcription factor [Falsibacillus pallidus]|uniref:ArsR/SmtB family transcription factor n=1 Tax=Falsibacillus pallidus TaxID=493781 RepID=UPI003D987B18